MSPEQLVALLQLLADLRLNLGQQAAEIEQLRAALSQAQAPATDAT